MTSRHSIHPSRFLAAAITLAALVVTGALSAAEDKSVSKDKPVSKSSRKIEMRPGEKRSLELRNDERNPYARHLNEIVTIEDKEGVPEEDRIRQVFMGLEIGGRSDGPNGPRVLVGDMILEEGKVVPPVLEDQTEHLMVKKITREEIELAWFDGETGDLTGRRMNLKFDLGPVVNYILKGQRGRLADGKTVAKPKFARMRAPATPRPETFSGNPKNADQQPGRTSATIAGPNAVSPAVPTAQNNSSSESGAPIFTGRE